MTTPTTMTLTGYLGADRELRLTRTRTKTLRIFNPGAECYDETEITTRPREYVRLSLATHRRVNGEWETTWHQLVVWNADRMENFHILLSRKGHKVTVTGHYETFRFTGDDGQQREMTRFIVEGFHLWPDKRTRPQSLRRPARKTRHLGTILGAFCPLNRPGRPHATAF
jgi:single-stranded DNA-binding protein